MIECYVKEPSSNQDWTGDPDLIWVGITEQNMESLKKALKLLRESGANCMDFWWMAQFQTYTTLDNYFDETDESKVIEFEGVKYVEEQPEYKLGGSTIKLFADGQLMFVAPFKYSGDELWAELPIIVTGE